MYYLHNDVASIERVAAGIRERVPEARIGIGHGKMSEQELSEVWRRLMEHEIDVLVCTTIIETGVDVPNANTLIIDNADRMGLSQLHQLRGRVGRSTRRAYAYFTFTRGKVLSEISQKRLAAIREFTEFGSGFKIAMRDLEIRGAGNILGGEQHGHMESVGYDMYLKLLNEAVAMMKGEAPENPWRNAPWTCRCRRISRKATSIPPRCVWTFTAASQTLKRMRIRAMLWMSSLTASASRPKAFMGLSTLLCCATARHSWHYGSQAAGKRASALQRKV